MHRLKIAPSEVRAMTLGEIYSVLWAVQDENTVLNDNPDHIDELYQELQAAKAKQKAAK